MNTPTQDTQHRTMNVKMKLVGIALIVATLCTLWWLADSTDADIKIASTQTTPSAATQQSVIQENIETDTLQDATEELPSEQKQSQLFDELWLKLHDQELRDTLTARQLLETPGFNTLSTEEMQRLVNEAIALLDQNELDSSVFLAKFSHKGETLPFAVNDGIIEVTHEQAQASQITTEATPEQELAMEKLRQDLRDPATAETLTAAQLLKSPEVQTLPEHLRNKLANEVIAMLARGEINSTTFLATPLPDQPEAPLDEESQRAAITHEQWQAFEDLQARLNDPGFQADQMLPQILTSQEYKTLPAYLRDQLSAEAAKIIEQ